MGTVLEITLAADVPRARMERLFAIAARLDRLLTRHAPDSALQRLNAAAGRGPQRVHPELARVLAQSIALSALTRGAFDVTVGPLVELWTAAAARNAPPGAAELRAARALVGSDGLRALPPDTAEILRPGAQVDLGAVAKGHALDRMAAELRHGGVASALLSFGQSSLWALGTPPDGPGWRLLIAAPDGGFAGRLTLRERAVSVSGSLGQWSEIGGRRYGHVIDPRSGQPLRRAVQAVALCDTAALAEALSTALLVLGAREGIALAASLSRCEALILEPDAAPLRTPGFPPLEPE